jgi:hypothetical protein
LSSSLGRSTWGVLGVGAFSVHQATSVHIRTRTRSTQRRRRDGDHWSRSFLRQLGPVLRQDPRRQGRRRDPGAMPVSRNGDLALVKGVGGAMDLVHARQESPRLME